MTEVYGYWKVRIYIRICIFKCYMHAWACCKNKTNTEKSDLLKSHLQWGVLFCLFVWIITQRKILFRYHKSYFIQRKATFIQTRMCIWVLLLKKSIDYGWCFLSQCFITRCLDEACFSITDDGKEDCLWCEWVAVFESFSTTSSNSSM